VRRLFSIFAVVSGLFVVSTIALSAERNIPAFRPGLGDLMTMMVQPRHIKLALAGRARNWPYAAYELHELEESFERIAHQVPQWHSIAIPDMLDGFTKQPMAALSRAIKAGDADRFAAAYGQLTTACNSCHMSMNRGMIVIKEPESAAFPDQDFRPLKP